MEDEDQNGVEFDIEDIMAEIKVASPELADFLAYVSGAVEEGNTSDVEMHSILELVYSYAKFKNDEEEERMMDGRV